jgi:glycosyltransferase involved in cell wall biosynthesis
MPEYIKSDIKLTIGIIVSNHLEYVKKGMESIQPLLKAVPSELIVIDTVGEENSDGSLAVAKEYTDRVYHFAWVNDFAAARNAALERAKGEWFMFYDDDEYFDDVTELIEFFTTDECDKYNSGLYYSGNYDRPDHYTKSIVGRLVKRTSDTRFVGRIHEAFNEFEPPVKLFNVFTHHFGYLYQTEEQKKAKVQRNIRLIEKEIEENGPSLKYCVQLVQELTVTDGEAAARKSLEFIKVLEKDVDTKASLWQWLLLVNIRNMAEWAVLDIITAMRKSLEERWALSDMSRLVIAHILVCAAYAQKRYAELAVYAKEYLELYDRLAEREQDRLAQTALDFSMYYSGEYLNRILSYTVIGELYLGDTETAMTYYNRLDPTVYIENAEELGEAIEYLLDKTGNKKAAEEYYKRSYKDEFFEKEEFRKYLPKVLRTKKTEE